jgi:hypothetical protein
MRTLPEEGGAKSENGSSPTLSEAERSLEAHLEGLTPVGEWASSPWEDVEEERPLRRHSVPRKPLPPPKSARRLSLRAVVEEEVETNTENIKVCEDQQNNTCALTRSSSIRSVLSLIAEEDGAATRQPQIACDDAEKVIYAILSRVADLRDLFSLATINRGFYRLFKSDELALTERAVRATSPAAWEFMRSCGDWARDEPDSAAPPPEDSAQTYWARYARSAGVLAGVKALMAQRCRFVLRPETARGLAEHDPLRPSRVDDALWRIWTFGCVFGRGRGREEDAAAQADWLRGGREAHDAGARGTIASADSVFMQDGGMVVTSEHFGRGNGPAGLSAEELYDVTELWNCVRSVSQGVVGRTEQARAHGVFDDTDVRGGDIEGEEVMLGSFLPAPSFQTTNESHRGVAQLHPDPRPRARAGDLLCTLAHSGIRTSTPQRLDALDAADRLRRRRAARDAAALPAGRRRTRVRGAHLRGLRADGARRRGPVRPPPATRELRRGTAPQQGAAPESAADPDDGLAEIWDGRRGRGAHEPREHGAREPRLAARVAAAEPRRALATVGV